MKKEFIVKSVDASPDGSPYVVVSLSSAEEMRDGMYQTEVPMGMPKFTGNLNDMMRDINKMLTMGAPVGVTSIKMDMHEYKQMNISVGDRVHLELTKTEPLGI